MDTCAPLPRYDSFMDAVLRLLTGDADQQRRAALRERLLVLFLRQCFRGSFQGVAGWLRLRRWRLWSGMCDQCTALQFFPYPPSVDALASLALRHRGPGPPYPMEEPRVFCQLAAESFGCRVRFLCAGKEWVHEPVAKKSNALTIALLRTGEGTFVPWAETKPARSPVTMRNFTLKANRDGVTLEDAPEGSEWRQLVEDRVYECRIGEPDHKAIYTLVAGGKHPLWSYYRARRPRAIAVFAQQEGSRAAPDLLSEACEGQSPYFQLPLGARATRLYLVILFRDDPPERTPASVLCEYLAALKTPVK